MLSGMSVVVIKATRLMRGHYRRRCSIPEIDQNNLPMHRLQRAAFATYSASQPGLCPTVFGCHLRYFRYTHGEGTKCEEIMATLAITPQQAITQLEQVFGLSDGELADALAASPRTLARWRPNSTYPQHEARERLARLVALGDRLQEAFRTPEAVRLWLQTESRYLGGFRPVDAIRLGRFDRVDAALQAL